MSVDRILQLGDDAHSNQFQIVFPNGIPTGGDDVSMALRLTGAFTMPQQTIYKYDIEYKGDKIPKTARKIDTDKVFTVTIRIDGNWKVYDELKAWHKAVYDPKTNTAMNDFLSRCPIVVQALDGSDSIVKSFTFTYCKIFDFKVTDFDSTVGDPLNIEAGFIYGQLDDE